MSKRVIKTANAPEPVGPYSQAIHAGPYLFCSGQIAIDPKTNEVLSTADIPTQTRQVMKNIEAVLKEAGFSFDHVIKSTIFLTKMSDFGAVNEIYGSYFKAQPPARSTVAVSELPKGVQVEVEVTAFKS